ncbi:hypothetical protein [Catenulispora subtropica]|uniref:WD40 domain protein beta Propeller n=1 Tax=Catenulispora subtropica TaxID=450798 RepID=A0ABN2QDB1_9ACTN
MRARILLPLVAAALVTGCAAKSSTRPNSDASPTAGSWVSAPSSPASGPDDIKVVDVDTEPSAPASAPIALPSGDSADTASSRPDGAQLLYRAEGGASAQNPAYSRDGKQLLATVFHQGYNKGDAAVGLLSPSGPSAFKALLDEKGSAAVNLPGTSWSPTGDIVFADDRGGGHDEIWRLTPGGKPRRVTDHEQDFGYSEPTFSPDGKTVVFQDEWTSPGTPRNAGDDAEQDSIWTAAAAGGAPVLLVDGRATHTDNRQPDWSPTGDRILFQRRSAGGQDWALYTVRADGTELRKIAAGPGEQTDATWSPDGRRVVFSSTTGTLDHAQIFVVSADGGTPIRVTHTANGYDGAPTWSPDGKWIAFESSTGRDEEAPAALWRITAPAM